VTTDASALRSALTASGLRLTRERNLLLDVIARHPHSDATEIHAIARRKSPRIGLATVYRTLRVLEELGVVEARRLGEDHSHYEVRQRDHLHVVCARCGALADIPLPIDVHEVSRQTGYTITRVRLEVVGLCPACAARERR